MATTGESIESIMAEIKKTPYNKATQLHIGKLKAKLAKFREKNEVESKKKAGKGFSVKKERDATVILVGFPSVGKSTLINALTNAKSEVAAYDFTTLTPIPGVMNYRGAEIQIIDIPGIIEGASKGKGMGREILAQARVADLILIVVDSTRLMQEEIIKEELRDVGIRLDRKRPDITVNKMFRGGIEIARSVKTGIPNEVIKVILQEYGYHNAYVQIRDVVSEDEFIDALSKSIVYTPSIIVINKVDEFDPKYPRSCVKISAERGDNLERLREMMWDELSLIRIYLKRQGQDADMEEPLILKKGATIKTVCKKVIRNFETRFRYAQIWGKRAKFEGQRIGLEHALDDEDIVSIITTI